MITEEENDNLLMEALRNQRAAMSKMSTEASDNIKDINNKIWQKLGCSTNLHDEDSDSVIIIPEEKKNV